MRARFSSKAIFNEDLGETTVAILRDMFGCNIKAYLASKLWSGGSGGSRARGWHQSRAGGRALERRLEDLAREADIKAVQADELLARSGRRPRQLMSWPSLDMLRTRRAGRRSTQRALAQTTLRSLRGCSPRLHLPAVLSVEERSSTTILLLFVGGGALALVALCFIYDGDGIRSSGVACRAQRH